MACGNSTQHLGSGWAPSQQSANCTMQPNTTNAYLGSEPDPMMRPLFTQQRDSLLALRAALGNLYTTQDWARLNLPCGSPAWPSVACGPARLVVGLDLSGSGLMGTLPGAQLLAVSPALESLDLSFNGLSGGIPASMLQMVELRVLKLQYNMLGGTLPDGFNNMYKLEELDLSGNKWTVGAQQCIDCMLLSLPR